LKRALSSRGLTARRLAEIAGLSEVTISHAARGKHIAPQTLQRISDALSRIPPLASAGELLEVL